MKKRTVRRDLQLARGFDRLTGAGTAIERAEPFQELVGYIVIKYGLSPSLSCIVA